MTASKQKLRELLSAEREIISPTALDRRRNRLALARRISFGAAAGVSTVASGSWGAWIASAPVKFIATVALAATSSGSVAWLASSARDNAASGARPAPSSRAPSSGVPTRPALGNAVALDRPLTAPSSSVVPVAQAEHVERPSDSSSSRAPAARGPTALDALPDALTAQARVLSAARAALRTGEPATALQLLERGDSSLSVGPLSEELAATRVFALCQLGRRAEAFQAAQSFAARYPGSALRQRVDAACPPPR